MAARRSTLGFAARILAIAALLIGGLFLLALAIDSFVRPVSTLMIGRKLLGKNVERVYVPLKDISPAAIEAVVASEDASFCANRGVDWASLREVVAGGGSEGPKRGASTITMQVAKNLFLWPGRSAIRKGLEIGAALALGLVWSKPRVIEVYFNIAEWGDGLYGIEAASRRYFHKSAAQINAREAALLATALPNPVKRDPARPSALQRRLAAHLTERVQAEDNVGCLARQASP